MIALQKLTAVPAPDAPPFKEPRGITSAVHFELRPGSFIHITLGAEGILLRHADAGIAIPLHELINLAVAHDPRLILPPAQPAAPAKK